MKYISRCLFSSKVMVWRFTVCNLHEFAAFWNLIVRFCQLVIAIEKFFFIGTEMLLKIMASCFVIWLIYLYLLCVPNTMTWVDKHFLFGIVLSLRTRPRINTYIMAVIRDLNFKCVISEIFLKLHNQNVKTGEDHKYSLKSNSQKSCLKVLWKGYAWSFYFSNWNILNWVLVLGLFPLYLKKFFFLIKIIHVSWLKLL